MRIASALVLGTSAIAAAWWGGWPFAVFWMLAALGVLWEWGHFVSAAVAARLAGLGGAALVAAVFAVATAGPFALLWVLVAAVLVAAGLCGLWGAAGMLYAGSLAGAPILLRGDAVWGLATIAVLFAVVWGSDIAAYFAGRLLGGPKLWPRVSPKKTWSGALAGAAAGAIGAAVVGRLAGIENAAALAAIGLLLSIASQLGDLLESGIKRHFGAKDASHLIPGHGGLMDRLDGFIVAAALAALIGLARGGLDAPARGLLIW
ncbi:MAG TPA: phosphatidate cytidylyltransferase [Xanthobacteraceae bacterium]|nr:phosphatidate cytidylyltransferase [Xanthobacteraceae bacterium]